MKIDLDQKFSDIVVDISTNPRTAASQMIAMNEELEADVSFLREALEAVESQALVAPMARSYEELFDMLISCHQIASEALQERSDK